MPHFEMATNLGSVSASGDKERTPVTLPPKEPLKGTMIIRDLDGLDLVQHAGGAIELQLIAHADDPIFLPALVNFSRRASEANVDVRVNVIVDYED